MTTSNPSRPAPEEQPVSQEKKGFRESWPMWMKQMPRLCIVDLLVFNGEVVKDFIPCFDVFVIIKHGLFSFRAATAINIRSSAREQHLTFGLIGFFIIGRQIRQITEILPS